MVEVYLSHDRRECDKFTNPQAMMCHRCESGAIALSHVTKQDRKGEDERGRKKGGEVFESGEPMGV